MYYYICKFCKIDFATANQSSKFCSRKCWIASTKKTITCLNCELEFIVNCSSKRKFCSRNCANKFNSNVEIHAICPNCQVAFTYKSRKKKFCSRKCFAEYKKPKPKTCPECKQQFYPRSHSKNPKHCSPKCQANARKKSVMRLCKNCKKPIMVTPSLLNRKRYCSRKCQLSNQFSSQQEKEVVSNFSKILNESPEIQYTTDWLKNPSTGRHLYVDAYFPEHNLIVEYDGKQHFIYVPFYHKSYKQFESLQYRDKIKELLIAQHNIALIRIRYDEPKTLEHFKTRISNC